MTTEKMFRIQGWSPSGGLTEKCLGWILHCIAYVVCMSAYNQQMYLDYGRFIYVIKQHLA